MIKDYCVTNCRIVTPREILTGKSIVVRDGAIESIRDIAESGDECANLPKIDAQQSLVAPSLFEFHFHGCAEFGFELYMKDPIQAIAQFLDQRGVHTIVPTIQCNEHITKKLAEELDANPHLRKKVPGIYVEGPFLSFEKKGGILPQFIKKPNLDYVKKLLDMGHGYIKIMTVAPEIEGSSEIIDFLQKNNIIVSLGHSNCQLSQIPSFIDRRRLNITHLFNGMAPISHKTTGLAMLPFLDRDIFFEFNADGVHCNSQITQIVARYLNLDRCILISDAVVSAGLSTGSYSYYGKAVSSDERGVRYKDSGTLIGSNRLIPDVVRNFIQTTGCPLPAAIACATLNPCQLLGIDSTKGSIEAGKEADFIFLDDDFLLRQIPFPPL
ncbi:MAG: amidohydrolase family protein [Chitinivibrionales bacterium]|nr:amidohydrolase family protein [Chitinivibrionales bacterium]